MPNNRSATRIILPTQNRQIPSSRLLLTEPIEIIGAPFLKKSMLLFPDKLRLSVAQAVANILDAENAPEDQKRTVKSCLNSLAEIYLITGEKTLLSWCKAIIDCGNYLGQNETRKVLSGILQEVVGDIDFSRNGGKECAARELIQAAETLPRIVHVLYGKYEGDDPLSEQDRIEVATSLSVIGGIWGTSSSVDLSHAISSVELDAAGFILAVCRAARSNGNNVQPLAQSLDSDASVFWAMPEVSEDTVQALIRRPKKILARTTGIGAASDLSLTLMERKETLGRLSVSLDARSLQHPDQRVRQAAIERILWVVTDTSKATNTRTAAMMVLHPVAEEIPLDKLSVLRTTVSNESVCTTRRARGIQKHGARLLVATVGYEHGSFAVWHNSALTAIGSVLTFYKCRRYSKEALDAIGETFTELCLRGPPPHAGGIAMMIADMIQKPRFVRLLDGFENNPEFLQGFLWNLAEITLDSSFNVSRVLDILDNHKIPSTAFMITVAFGRISMQTPKSNLSRSYVDVALDAAEQFQDEPDKQASLISCLGEIATHQKNEYPLDSALHLFQKYDQDTALFLIEKVRQLGRGFKNRGVSYEDVYKALQSDEMIEAINHYKDSEDIASVCVFLVYSALFVGEDASQAALLAKKMDNTEQVIFWGEKLANIYQYHGVSQFFDALRQLQGRLYHGEPLSLMVFSQVLMH